ncbi:hypothetical protein [Kitasatospora cineracea]|uniref:hypothetical protein n=1 Tax=Kitasatospora cineracea TaxID=88074 RepID=UPI003792BF84
MSEDEAERAASALRRRGVRAVAVPEDPYNPDGEWRVYDGTDPVSRRDITEEAREAAMDRPGTGCPTRGFVIPPRF